MTFPSGSEAAQALDLNRTVVSLCCIGRQRSVDESYSFRFADAVERERTDTLRKSCMQKQYRDETTSRHVEVYDIVSGDTIQVSVDEED